MTRIPAVYNLRDTTTGEVRQVVWDRPEDWRDGTDGDSLFVWSEHNWSCDCNRELMFTDWENPDQHGPCGEARYRLRVTASDDGRILYDEWEMSA